ncbi:MAG: hypothetical protein HC813_02775, partial [Planctomycetes bacterium]|nr:hypothetical protein [Planctomycetota bacterium]
MSEAEPITTDRRGFLGTLSATAMAGGLLAGYGAFFGVAGRFLYPPPRRGRDGCSWRMSPPSPPGTSRPYRTPQWSYIFRHVADRGWAFVRKAGTVILGLMILLWAAQTYPKTDSEDPGEQLNHSLVGRISHIIEPVVRPMGFDGRTGTAILTSFAAREVFVGSMAQLFQVEESEDEEEQHQVLQQQQQQPKLQQRQVQQPLQQR